MSRRTRRPTRARRLIAAVGAALLAVAPVPAPGPAGPAAASVDGPPAIEEALGFPLVGELAFPGEPINHVIVGWDEIIDPNSIPFPGDFTVTAPDAVDHQPTDVSLLFSGLATEETEFGIDGVSFMRLDLPFDWFANETLLVDYVPGRTPDSSPVQDLAGTDAVGFLNVEAIAPEFGEHTPVVAAIDSYHGSDRLVVVIGSPIADGTLPLASQFSVTVELPAMAATPVAVDSVTDLYPDIGLAFLELLLEEPVTDPDAVVRVSYTLQPGRAVSRWFGTDLESFDINVLVVVANDDASADLDPGEALSTATPDGPTPGDPVATTLTTTGTGPATISEGPVVGDPPAGYGFFGQQIDITMPPAPSADEPNRIRFVIDASVVPPGETAATLQLFRNGQVVPACVGAVGVADPTPCVSLREALAGGDIALTALTVEASTWNMGVALPFAFGGYQPPVNGDVPNLASAGSAIPVRFSLDGDRGLEIFAAGSPSVRFLSCSTLADGAEVEETITAGQSSLRYNASTDTYTYVWKTSRAWGDSCRRLVLDFVDGSQASAVFDFRR